MAEVIAPNIPTNCASLTAITEREAQHAALGENATPFTDGPGDGSFGDPYLGMNRAGGSNPGVGICTGLVYQTAEEVAAGPEIFTGWTELDQGDPVESGESQTPLPRIPQNSGTIGHIDASSLAEDITGTVPAFTPAVVPVTVTVGADINNTADFVITDTAAADGDVMDTVSGAINNTGETVGVGDLIWGQVPVA